MHAGLATTRTLTPALARLAIALPCSAIMGTFLAIRLRRSMPLHQNRQPHFTHFGNSFIYTEHFTNFGNSFNYTNNILHNLDFFYTTAFWTF